jgi:hypothetical protein
LANVGQVDELDAVQRSRLFRVGDRVGDDRLDSDSRNSLIISKTFVTRASGQFSLNVNPRIATRAPLTVLSALIKLLTRFSAT